MAPWIPYALVALVLFGLSGLTQKLATNYISTELSTVCYALTYVPIAIAILATQKLSWDIPSKDWTLSILTGVLFGLAVLVQFAAYRYGTASVVTALTSLGTAATVIIALPVFKEKLNVRKVVGILLALAAGAALSYEKSAKPEAPAPPPG